MRVGVLMLCLASSVAFADDETPAEETPAEDAPAEDAPAEGAPAEDAPAEDAPAEDAPAEDAPAEDDAPVASLFDDLAETSERVNVRDDGFVLAVDFGTSFLTATGDGSSSSLTFQYGFHFGYRFNDWTLLVHVEHGTWRAPELGAQAWQHAANIGVGFERFYVSAFLRTQLVIGTSILLRSNDLDDAPQAGIFFDFRPLGINWEFRERWAFVLDLLHIAVVAPVLTGVPLADIQFRSGLSFEHTF